jgi:hypothetical protein
MTIQELNELIENWAAQPAPRKREEAKRLGWMLDQQEQQAAGAPPDALTVQELNELIQHAVAQPGRRADEDSKLLGWMLELQAA